AMKAPPDRGLVAVVGRRAEARGKIMQIAAGRLQHALDGADGRNDLAVMIAGQAWDQLTKRWNEGGRQGAHDMPCLRQIACEGRKKRLASELISPQSRSFLWSPPPTQR